MGGVCVEWVWSQIDMKKMPLGKLSHRQMRSAYTVLTELQQEVAGPASPARILDASNRYTAVCVCVCVFVYGGQEGPSHLSIPSKLHSSLLPSFQTSILPYFHTA